MKRTTRTVRDGLLALLVVLAPYAAEQWLLCNHYTAAVTMVGMGAVLLLYRYADARALEALAQTAPDDADEFKPILRRAGKALEQLVERAQERRKGGE